MARAGFVSSFACSRVCGSGDVDDVSGPHAGELCQDGGGMLVPLKRLAGGVGLGKGLSRRGKDIAGHARK
ncbi:hypothetical protein SAMN05444921_1365 [Streptomyces wuyuanensis]|uniref:Uncharacterized protein n=1 Tax=Streptomyces wuyuanensis TaxID=1196353 RepID=A0A1H0DSI9_9ACTN|nr:hypothetical protein SAMN05444921_1365 [Streptomyces wuyuanensis]